jgi:hypothetical protein
MNYKNLILGKLLDKYENSKSFTDGASKRRVMLRLSSELPEYDVENPIARETFNSMILELSQKGLISYEWLKYEKDNIIDKVWLDIACVNSSYALIGRKAKRAVLDNLLFQVKDILSKSTSEWIIRFFEEIVQSIETKNSIAGLLPSDEEQAYSVLKAINSIQSLGDEGCLERVFSLRFFGDSKYFEKKLRAKVVGIIRKYYLGLDASEEVSDDDLLMQVGIYHSPDMIDFKGGISGRIAETDINFSAFLHGISINAETVRDLEITGTGNVSKVLFIENKANFIDFNMKNSDSTIMTVFHGGFYSPCKGLFFKKLYYAALDKNIEFYHWGDIDLGGFKIFKRLKFNIIPEIKPYLMDKEAFVSKIEYAAMFDSQYADKLKQLLEDNQYSEFWDVLKFMIENGIKLEQESFLI